MRDAASVIINRHNHTESAVFKLWMLYFQRISFQIIYIAFDSYFLKICSKYHLGRVKRIWYLSPMRAAKVQASLRIRAVSPEPSLLAHKSSESGGTFRQKTRSLAPLNGWTCAVEICHDGMLEDTNSLDGAHFQILCVKLHSFSHSKQVMAQNFTSAFMHNSTQNTQKGHLQNIG